jgi:hypothetical protein
LILGLRIPLNSARVRINYSCGNSDTFVANMFSNNIYCEILSQSGMSFEKCFKILFKRLS